MNNKIKPMTSGKKRAKNVRNIAKHKAEAIAKLTREQLRKKKHLQEEEDKRKKASERKRQERSRYSEKGLISITVRIKPSKKEALLQYVEGLNRNDNC